MEIIFLPTALAGLPYWKKSGNTIILKRIRQLLEVIQQQLFEGIGKPKTLKYQWAGKWSGRINQEHRINCKVGDNKVTVYALRYHFSL